MAASALSHRATLLTRGGLRQILRLAQRQLRMTENRTEEAASEIDDDANLGYAPSISRALAIRACSLGCVARASASSKLNHATSSVSESCAEGSPPVCSIRKKCTRLKIRVRVAPLRSRDQPCDLVSFRVVRRRVAARMLHQEEMHALENPRQRRAITLARRIHIGDFTERFNFSHRKTALLARLARRGLGYRFTLFQMPLGHYPGAASGWPDQHHAYRPVAAAAPDKATGGDLPPILYLWIRALPLRFGPRPRHHN